MGELAGRVPAPSAEARSLAAALGVTETVAEWLLRRGHTEPQAARRFLEPKLADLTHPDAMVDRALAADRLASAIGRGERVVVFGDYDCDGITSAAVMTEVIQALGGEVRPLLASRFDGGYGVSPNAVQKIVDACPSVLVTCDCGSSDHEQLAEVATRGIDVIVIDHHLVPEEPLPALAFLNPHRPDCGFPYKGLASCGLALSVGAALRALVGRRLDLRRLLDLVAIGTIADVAPLEGDNRALVRAGLAVMRTSPRPGVRALLEAAKLDGVAPLRGEDVAFRIAPRLNAPGRLGAPDRALELLLAKTDEAARALAGEVEQQSAERKALQNRILAEAIEQIEKNGWQPRRSIVVGERGWNPGIVGIVAGRLASRYGLPSVVVGFDESDVGRGSVRGPPGARLYDALAACGDCLERYGGHQAAAGLEVRFDKLPALREHFESAIGAQPTPCCDSELADVVRLSEGEAPGRVVADLELLEPCGHKNPAPRMLVDARVERAKSVKGGHLKLELTVGPGHRLGGFGVGLGERAGSLGSAVRLLGRLRRDSWRGGDAAEIFVEQIL